MEKSDSSFGNEIAAYWTQRASGYSKVNREELVNGQKERWGTELISGILSAPCLSGKEKRPGIRVLDCGTGPGFFAILLAQAAFRVDAVDYTENMLSEAEKNACAEGISGDSGLLSFQKMNAEELTFPDETFDAVVSRNLTWNLPHPERAYSEWFRVLKKGGVLLNFDADWYGYLRDEKMKQAHAEDLRHVEESGAENFHEGEGIDTAWIERIARRNPLTYEKRPEWDVLTCRKLGYSFAEADPGAGERVLSEDEKINYASTPVFLVRAVR